MSDENLYSPSFGGIIELSVAEEALVSGGSRSATYTANLYRELEKRLYANKVATAPAKTAKGIQQSS